MTQERPKYWGSLEEYHETAEFKESLGKEFVTPPAEHDLTEIERRDFLKFMGAGMLLATTACYRRPVEKIIPYVNRPLEVVPGVPDYYTSTCTECSASCGLLVKTREGRPIKLEGNPEHPMNQGGLCARGQAGLLNLYDPDRLKGPRAVNRGEGSSKTIEWSELDDQIKEILGAAKQKGGKVYLLTASLTGPGTLQVIQDFLAQNPGAAHVAYEGVLPEEIGLAEELSYGQKTTPRYRFDQAQFILSFGADFLGTWLSPVEFAKQFSKTRKPEGGAMARFVAVESALTLTGSNADEYFAVKPGDEASVALALVHELTVSKGQSRDTSLSQLLAGFDADTVGKQTGIQAEALKNLAQDLWENKGKGLILGGGIKAKNALALQVAVNLLNSILGNDGVTVDTAVAPSHQVFSSYADLTKMIEEMRQGKVEVLFIYKANPLYNLPAALNFAEALKQVPHVVSLADREDETALASNFIAPPSHPLESWGDANPQKGLYSLIQPTIRPLYSTRTFEDSLIQWAALPYKSWYDYLKNHWQQKIFKEASGAKPFDAFWSETLQKGYFDALGEKRAEKGSPNSRSVSSKAYAVLQNVKPLSGDLFLSLYPSVALFDGRSANNGWLQELPDPLSKITWDNYLSVAPRTAKKMGLEEGDVVKLEGVAGNPELPIHIQPKMSGQTAMTAVGYGRTRAGRLGNRVGVNTFPLQKTEGDLLEWAGRPITLTKTGRKERLATTQGHGTLEGRPIIQELSYAEYRKNPEAEQGKEESLPTMWREHKFPGYRWGMAIDLTACIGCSACMIGCMAENNIPVVGKTQVANGREMHWIRIDRYYSGNPDQPEVTHQPMLCQHCENAPCETVCPVIATAHNAEGLNMQIYNRCVGTRYCSNNCPYKVRRFNFFDYYKQLAEPLNLVLNPDVTTRSRGVMEKCSFCIQRINEAKDKAKAQGKDKQGQDKKVEDGAFKTACQQTCPTNAITFGNINDRNSMISKQKHSPRGYHVLEDLNVKPSITYLKKVRNKTGEA